MQIVGKRSSTDSVLLYLSGCYFMWGYITVICTSLLPTFQQMYALSYSEAAIFPAIFFISRVVISIPTGWLLSRLGYKKTLMLSIWACALGCLSFAATLPFSWLGLSLLAYTLLSCGLSAIQVVAQPYVSLTASSEQSSQRQGFASACNSIGTTIGPIVLAALITFSLTMTQSSVIGLVAIYLLTGLGALSLLFTASKVELPTITPVSDVGYSRGFLALGTTPKFVIAAFVLSLCVGVEVAIGTYTIHYLLDLGMDQSGAIRLLSIYWMLMLAGRIGMARYGKAGKLSTWQLLSSALAALACAAAVLLNDFSGAAVLILCGLFNSTMYPIIYTKALDCAGRFTNQASVMLIMASIGGALVPIVQASAIDGVGVAQSFAVLAVIYLMITVGSYKVLK